MQSVGSAEAAPGECAIGRLDVGEDRDGSILRLPVAVINGVDEGETLYIQAVSDGDELNGLGVISGLIPSIDPTELKGTVLVVGIVNMHGFRAGEHRNPVDDTKINRTYPGDANGSSSERLAAATFELAESADYVLDLHQGSTSRMIEECRVRCGQGHRLHDACLELARVFGCGFILDRKGPDGQLARAAPDAGVPAIDPELGGSVGWDHASIAAGIRGVENVLTYYDFLPGEVSVESQVRAQGFTQYGAPSGGLVHYDAALGDHVRTGDALFTVKDVFGQEQDVVEAESAGIFWRTRRRPQVASGEYVCTIGTNVDEV